jgi:hypothetical protein
MPAYLWCTPSASGMAPCGRPTCNKSKPACNKCGKPACSGDCDKEGKAISDLPPNAVEGECYAKAFIPAQYKTVSERVMTKEASETIEIIPAEYKWVEERVMVKECSKQLEQTDAEYKTQERTVMVKPGHTGWVLEKTARCATADNKEVRDVYCLVTTPPEYKTISTKCQVKPACVREVMIPAEYETVRRQVVASPARTKKNCIAAEYEDIEKTVLVCDAMVKWEHIVCKEKETAETINKVKNALAKSGYKTDPANGVLTPMDWTALTEFQVKNRLGVGELSYQTLEKLGVSTPNTVAVR